MTKRLERGRFVWPQAQSGSVALSSAQLAMLLEGIDWRHPSAAVNNFVYLRFMIPALLCESKGQVRRLHGKMVDLTMQLSYLIERSASRDLDIGSRIFWNSI